MNAQAPPRLPLTPPQSHMLLLVVLAVAGAVRGDSAPPNVSKVNVAAVTENRDSAVELSVSSTLLEFAILFII